jgi:glycosyltransferase involved in cell wall biosynthesis
MDNMKRTAKKVAVIIPTLNEEQTIGSMVKSLNENSYPNKDVIIVDGGSTDNTAGIAKGLGATVLRESGKRGFPCPANARNQGARHADADILCFIDADGEDVEKDFLENGMKSFDGNTSAVYGVYRTKHDTLLEKILLRERGLLMNPTFIRKDVFLEIGGFPPIGYGEDWLFTRKAKEHAKRNGLNEGFVEKPFFTGHGVHTLKALYKQRVWYGSTSLMFLRQLEDRVLFHSLRVYYQPIYFLSFLTLFLVPFSGLFIITALPFFAIFVATLIRNAGSWGMGKVVLSLFSGLAMLHGLLSSVTRPSIGHKNAANGGD